MENGVHFHDKVSINGASISYPPEKSHLAAHMTLCAIRYLDQLEMASVYDTKTYWRQSLLVGTMAFSAQAHSNQIPITTARDNTASAQPRWEHHRESLHLHRIYTQEVFETQSPSLAKEAGVQSDASGSKDGPKVEGGVPPDAEERGPADSDCVVE
ncbi:hypothetical protein QJS04_geneDACA018157 [Acorus gramineus]|uniref:Uncharacterized protein n=1 Tax=Acorus gramineus TaxID=55184 RepID=A0AAV9ALK2_ACOGR|nr:hypothetical protein QJS04_geneDACA018157 [Acorus gramineus]